MQKVTGIHDYRLILVAKFNFSYAQGYSLPPGMGTDNDQRCKVVLSMWKTASFDDADPHMVQNGVPCGDDRFCVLGIYLDFQILDSQTNTSI